MNVCLNTYPWALGTPGGGERQLEFYHGALLRGQTKWPNLTLSLFDQWRPDFNEMGLMHYFSCMPSSRDFIDYVKTNQRVSLVVSPNFWPEPEGWEASGVHEAIRTILWLADRVIVNSVTEKEVLTQLCNVVSPENIAVVHNAVDDCFFKVVSPELFRESFNIKGAFVLNVANVEPRKNQLAFLKALRAFPDLTLITIGGVREKSYLDACREEGRDQFRLVDPLPPGCELMRSAIAGCEFFAMPSLRETPSIASLEAGAAGARILTTDLGSPTEYFEKHAVYVNPYDSMSMKNGIEEVLSSNRDQALVERIRTLYRWDVVVEKLVDTYSAVLGNNLRVRV